ncbi:MAG TPA: hypothetical protein VGR37_12530 [Longimicrobiaceae bacterium]|nr:hypothetical protein [Longimicrobiaceae bacterium]
MVLGTALDHILEDWSDRVSAGDKAAEQNFRTMMRMIAGCVHEARARKLLGLQPLPDGRAAGPFTS